MKKVIYIIPFLFLGVLGNSQNLVFSWEGALFTAPNPDHDSVYLYVQNTGMEDVYLVGFNARMYFSSANVGLGGPSNPTFTLSGTALAGGLTNLITSTQTVNPALTMLGNTYDRFVGVGPAVVDQANFEGMLLEGEGMIAPDPEGGESTTSLPIKVGTFRFNVLANQGGSGCVISDQFALDLGGQVYTSSLTPTWQGLTGPCAAGCILEYQGDVAIPEQGNQCCALCGLLSASPLPVELIRFTATKYKTDGTSLFWQTATEENVSHFEIERSRDASNWEMVAKANAHGNSQSIYSYSTIDHNVYDGRSPRALFYYRLKIVDNDGSSQYSGIQTVRFTTNTGVFGAYIYPNPSSEDLTVEFNYADDSAPVRDLLIYNNLGQLVYSQEIAEGQDVVYLNHATTGLIAGSYTLELRDVNNNPMSQDKIVVQR